MSIDISTIGVEFQTDGLVKGTAALKNAELAANKTADAADEISRAAKTMDKSMGSAMTSIRNHLGTLAAGFSALQTASKLVNVQREFDVLNSSLITVTGSSAKAAQEFAWIKQFAATTPYQLNEVTGAFVKMKALGLDASQKALTSYGNTASAMGKGINQMIEAVADAATGEFERLKEFGIKAKQNGDQVSLTFQGVTKTIGNNATEITKYLTAIGEVEFSGAMAERAKTLDGALSNLADSWDELFRTVNQNATGTVIFDSVSLASKAVSDAITIIKSMNDVTADNAKQTGAMAVVQEALAVVFETVAVLGANVKYVLFQVGNELGGIAAQAVQILQGDFAGAAAIRQAMVADGEAARREIDATTERILGARKAAEDLAKWNTRNASANSDPRRVDLASAAPKATTATKKSLDEAAKALEFYNDLMDLASGYSKTYAEDQRKLALALNNGSINYDQYVAAVQKLMSLQPGVIAAIKAEEKATKDRVANTVRSINAELDAYYKERDAIDGVSKSLNDLARTNADYTDQLEFEASLAGQSATDRATAIEQYKLLARYKLEAAKINDSIADPAVRAAQLAQLDLQKQIALSNAGRAAGMAEWNKTFDDIRDGLTDAFMSAIDGTKSLWVALRDSVVGMFKNMVLRPIIQGVMQPVATALTGSLIGTAANAATGASATSGLLSSVTGIGAAAGQGSISSLLGSSSMGALDVGGLSMAGIKGALAAIPVWGWELMATAAVAAIASGRGETRMGASYVTGADGKASLQMGPSGGEIAGDTAKSLFNATKTSIQDTLKLVGSSATVSGFVAGLESSKDGKGFAYAGGLINGKGFGDYKGRDGGQFGFQTMNAEQAMSAYVNELKKSTLEALQAATDIPKLLSDQLAGIDINALDQVGLDKLVGAISSTVNAVNGFVTQINTSGIKELHDLGFAAAAGLIAASGGLDQLNTNLSTYYSNFYSAEEQRLQTIKTINAATAGSGLDAATATRESFRHLVEAQDLTTLSGQTMYASLMGVAGAFAGIVPAATDAAASTKSLTSGIKTLVSGISTSVSDSIFGMQYGLEDNKGKYNMLDVRGARIDGQMRASTDIADIAKLAADQIALLNQAWALMGVDQQKVQLVAFEDKLTAIDDFVKEKGADPVALAKAQAKETADTIAAAVKTAVAEALAAPAASIDSAAASIQAAADTPAVANITVSVSAPKGQEVNIT